MSATRDAGIAARVPHDLRADLEKLAARDGVELSIVIRRILREGADRELGGQPTILEALWPGYRRRAGATEVEARLKAAPKVGQGRFNALAEYELAGARGLTADEVAVKLEPAPMNGTAKRVSELAQGGLIREARTAGDGRIVAASTMRGLAANERVMDDGHVARTTRADAWATVYVITPAGHRALEDARANHRQAQEPTA